MPYHWEHRSIGSPFNVTFASVDKYAKEYYKEYYTLLPAPNTIEIEAIPDKEFSFNTEGLPRMFDRRVKVGSFTKRLPPVILSNRTATSNVYACLTLTSALHGTVPRVYFGTKDKLLTTTEWSRVSWVQPFKDIYAGTCSETESRPHLRVVALYYLLAKAHLEKLYIYSWSFHRDLKAACRNLSAKSPDPQDQPLEENPMPISRQLSSSLSDQMRSTLAADSTTQPSSHSVLMKKRPREEDEASLLTSTRGEPNVSSSPKITLYRDPNGPRNDRIKVPNIDDLSDFVQEYKKLKTDNDILEIEIRKVNGLPQRLEELEAQNASLKAELDKYAQGHAVQASEHARAETILKTHVEHQRESLKAHEATIQDMRQEMENQRIHQGERAELFRQNRALLLQVKADKEARQGLVEEVAELKMKLQKFKKKTAELSAEL